MLIGIYRFFGKTSHIQWQNYVVLCRQNVRTFFMGPKRFKYPAEKKIRIDSLAVSP